MSVCRSCGAPILWKLTSTGSRMPMDPEPVEGGAYEILGERVVFAGATNKTPRYVSHFATCPDADEHRRKP